MKVKVEWLELRKRVEKLSTKVIFYFWKAASQQVINQQVLQSKRLSWLEYEGKNKIVLKPPTPNSFEKECIKLEIGSI